MDRIKSPEENTEYDPRSELFLLAKSFRNMIEVGRNQVQHLSPFCGSDYPLSEKPPPEQKLGSVTEVLPMNLDGVRAEIGDCQRCSLGKLRKTLVFGEGNPRADIVFVGEAPGGDEDIQGRPFVGAAGQLLTRIIAAMKLSRKDVYICNILKCRPPGNRNPRPEEISACEPFLIKQLAAIKPTVICALGTFAAHTLLKTGSPISVLRGRFHSYHGIQVMPTYHPAYVLRNPGAKKQVWEDVQIIMRTLNLQP